jgi:hypothetical protein
MPKAKRPMCCGRRARPRRIFGSILGNLDNLLYIIPTVENCAIPPSKKAQFSTECGVVEAVRETTLGGWVLPDLTGARKTISEFNSATQGIRFLNTYLPRNNV